MGGAGVPTTGEETDDMLPMNPEGYEVDDAQVQCEYLLTNAHIGQTPYFLLLIITYYIFYNYFIIC